MTFDLGPDEVNDLGYDQNGGQSMQVIGLHMDLLHFEVFRVGKMHCYRTQCHFRAP